MDFINKRKKGNIFATARRGKRRISLKYLKSLPVWVKLKARVVLTTLYSQQVVKERKAARFRCNNVLTKILSNQYPYLSLFWEFNAEPLVMDPARMTYKPLDNELSIHSVRQEDSGVYTCKMTYKFFWTQPVNVFALSIISNRSQVYVQQTLPLVLPCNGQALAEIFKSVVQLWHHNGTRVGNGTRMRSSRAKRLTTLEKVSRPDQGGLWVCTVSDSTGRQWETNRVNVVIGPPPGFLDLLLSRTKYQVAFVSVLVFIVFFVFGLCNLLYRRLKTWSTNLSQDSVVSYESLPSEPEDFSDYDEQPYPVTYDLDYLPYPKA